MESWAIVGLTLALVVVTGLYQRDTHRMVEEMRLARGAQLMPRVVVTARSLGGGNSFWRIGNIGPGPALNVDVELTPEPGGVPRRWTSPVLVPGETHDFLPRATPEDTGQELMQLDQSTARFARLRLSGKCRSVLGEVRQIEELFDIREWWVALKAADNLVPHDWAEESARSLKDISKNLRVIAEEAKRARERTGEG
jgi:hypothetical protein